MVEEPSSGRSRRAVAPVGRAKRQHDGFRGAVVGQNVDPAQAPGAEILLDEMGGQAAQPSPAFSIACLAPRSASRQVFGE